jgi:hypothetical protein
MNDLIQLKNLTNGDGKNITVSPFIVLSNKSETHSDWLSASKFEQVNEKEIGTDPISFELKEFKESNVDEGKIGQSGKAVNISCLDDNVVIKIYLASKRNDWKFSHEYTIAKELYNAYSLCIKNNTKTIELEKEAKNSKKFDLKLV